MAKIISAHSFRGGTGKSNTTANLACLAALGGKRVGIVDTDIQSPGIHVIFGLDPGKVNRSLNDFLWDRCGIGETSYDVTPAQVAVAMSSSGPVGSSTPSEAMPALFTSTATSPTCSIN